MRSAPLDAPPARRGAPLARPVASTPWRRRAAALVLAAAVAGPASGQDEADDSGEQWVLKLVQDAAAATDQHCNSLRGAQSADVQVLLNALGDVYGAVDKGYERYGAPELLYWRGVLGMCIGLNDNARPDFADFIRSQQEDPAYSGMVEQARARLRRLGTNSSITEGPAARWAARPVATLGEVRWAAGSGVHVLACTDDDFAGDEPMVENGPFLGQHAPAPAVAVAVAPLGLGGGVAHYVRPAVGLRVDVHGDVPLPLTQPANRSGGDVTRGLLPANYRPLPRLGLSVGPALRRQVTAAAAEELGAAWYFQASPAFGLVFAPLQPLAGNAEAAAEQGLLSPSLRGLLQPGLHLSWEGGVEAGQRLVFAIGGELQLHAPLPGAAALRLSEGKAVPVWAEVDADGDASTADRTWEQAEEAALVQPEPGVGTALRAAFWLRLLRPFGAVGNQAVGPQLLVSATESSLAFGNAPGDVWCRGEAALEGCPLGLRRKVYGTLRLDVLVQAGIVVRFGSKQAAQLDEDAKPNPVIVPEQVELGSGKQREP